MGLGGLTLVLWLPANVAFERGFASHGKSTLTLTDAHVRAIPKGLRAELRRWAGGEHALIVDAPSTDPATVVRALTRAAVDRWLTLSDEAFVREIPADFADEPRICARLGEILHRQDRAAKARAGLRAYASTIPYLARAAGEADYPIEVPALDHLTKAIAELVPGTRSLSVSSVEYKAARLELWKSPTPAAFALRDRVLDHVERLPKPEHVEVRVEPLSTYRSVVAAKGPKKAWDLGPSVEVVPVRVSSGFGDDRCVIFELQEASDSGSPKTKPDGSGPR